MNTIAKKKAAKKTAEPETFGLLLLSLRLSLTRRIERLLADRGFDISLTQFRVLRALSSSDSMSASALAREVEHDGGALTRLLDRLQDKGYVARRPNATDRRAIEVFLTAEGTKFWDSMKDCLTELNDDVLAVLNDKERTQLFSLLHRVRDGVDAQATP